MPSVNTLPLLMTDTLPLRQASDLPKYRVESAARYLPWVFGRATVNPVPLDTIGQDWLVADHPILSVDKVTVAGTATDGWQLQQRVDETGHGISVVRLSQPTTKEAVVVTVAGRKHPTTGALLETPGPIVREIMRLCKHVEDVGAWEGLDTNYGQVELGFVIDTTQTLRASLANVIEPLNAVWRPGWAAPKTPADPVATLTVMNTESITARTDTTTLGTTLRVSYAKDWAAGAARGAIRLGAPDAQERWGELGQSLELPTVRRARDALAFATTRLQNLGRASWIVEATVDARVGTVRAGQTVLLAHPHVPAGLALVTAVSNDREQSTLKITASMHTESAPRIELLRMNSAVDAAATAAPMVNYRDGVATITVSDAQGNPLANAAVTLDGLYTANTDSSGRVQFKTPRGLHTLSVSTPGFATFEIDVVV